MNRTPISRRALTKAATAALAAEAGAQLLTSPFLPRNPLTRSLKRAITDGDGRALADDSFPVAEHPIFILTVHAKWESAGWLARPNAQADGIVGNPLVEASSAFAGHGLTKMFGDYVLPLEGKVGFAIVPCSTTTGNHVYDGLRNTMDKTGCLPSYVTETAASLTSLHFASVGTADGATACFAKGGTQLITYSSMGAAVSSLLNALGPLKNLPPEAQKLLAELNDRVTKDQRLRQGLEALAGRLEAARQPLNDALALAAVKPPTLTADTQMDGATLAATNPLIPQINASASLINLGLLHAVTLSIANSDPNAGGDHAGRGGQNIAFGGRSPNEVKSCVAQAVARIYELFPNAVVSITSDGGRTADGGDTQNFEAFLFGPPDRVATTFINAESRADSAQFGSGPKPVTLSNGTTQAPSQAHVMSTAAKAAGLTLEGTPWVPGMLKG